MNIRHALKQAKVFLGDGALVRDDGRPSSPEKRALASGKLAACRELKKAKHPDFRRSEENLLLRDALHYRYRVGTNLGGIAFLVRGEGDTWEEALTAAKESKK